ncbi:adenylate/guanylate cyclase domain-containing protein [Tumebacillus permanentifrigoris]|nr:adenylate/guanylate cyclase domain-containing protein [Tumebacillus permanentifrigoris]
MKATMTILWSKIEEIRTQFELQDEELLYRFGEILEGLDSWDLFRINPLRFAATHELDPARVLNLFIYGTKVGLFELDWNLICPMCSCVEHTYNSLNQIAMGDTFRCTLCDVDVETELDNYVEVSFNLHPAVQDLQIDPFADHNSYLRYFFSQNFIRPQYMMDYIQGKAFKSFTVVPPHRTAATHLNGAPGELYRIASLDKHSMCHIQFTDEQQERPQTIEVELTANGLLPELIELAAGPVEILLHNRDSNQIACTLMYTNHLEMDCHASDEKEQMTALPFLSGKMLLNNQKFRETFLVENLPNGMNLKLSNLTVLFTDLKGSTALYEKTGDVEAYRLVQDHFRLLTDVVSQHSGATVKTMGDAIMASFSTPADGLTAALEMVREMKNLNDSLDLDATLEVKIGLHTGPALAVKANETIDFFGQTVNLAARVQGQARAGEVWISDAICQDAAARDVMFANGYTPEQHTITLKGVNSPSTVYRCVKR